MFPGVFSAKEAILEKGKIKEGLINSFIVIPAYAGIQ